MSLQDLRSKLDSLFSTLQDLRDMAAYTDGQALDPKELPSRMERLSELLEALADLRAEFAASEVGDLGPVITQLRKNWQQRAADADDLGSTIAEKILAPLSRELETMGGAAPEAAFPLLQALLQHILTSAMEAHPDDAPFEVEHISLSLRQAPAGSGDTGRFNTGSFDFVRFVSATDAKTLQSEAPEPLLLVQWPQPEMTT